MGDRRKLWTRAGYGLGAVVAVVLVVLVVVAVDHDWRADAWAALGTWATAVVALVAGMVAVGQLGEARRLRFEQAQPYVVAYMADNLQRPKWVDLVVRNFGNTAATDVDIKIVPSPERAAQVSDSEHFRLVALPPKIPVLVPGQEWRTLWDHIPRRYESDLPDRHEVIVSFKDSQRRGPFSFQFVLDWAVFRDRMTVTEKKP